LKVRANPASWRGYDPLPPEPVFKDSAETEEGKPGSEKGRDVKLKGHWNLRLSSFQKLVFIKTFEEEKVMGRFKLLCNFIVFFRQLLFVNASDANAALCFTVI